MPRVLQSFLAAQKMHAEHIVTLQGLNLRVGIPSPQNINASCTTYTTTCSPRMLHTLIHAILCPIWPSLTFPWLTCTLSPSSCRGAR